MHIVIELDPSRAIQFHLSQSLSNHVIRLSFRLLRGFDRRGLVQVSFIINVEFLKSILQAEDLVLLKLWIFPMRIIPRLASSSTVD